MVFLVEMVLIFAIFYFLLIRPQTQERKRHAAMLAGIKKGDEVSRRVGSSARWSTPSRTG